MTLSDVCELIVDCPHSTAIDKGEGFPLIRTPNIGKGALILDGVHRVNEDTYYARNQRAVPKDNDLIFAREAPAGNVAIIKNGIKVCLGQRTVLIRPNPELINPQFLVYYLLAPKPQHHLLETANGATVPHVNMSAIRNLQISIPSRDTQDQLSLILTSFDDMIENNQIQIKLLEEAAIRLYKEWFMNLRFPGYETTRIIDGLPDGWMRSKTKEFVKFAYGKALKAESRKEGHYPVYGSSGIIGYHNEYFVKAPVIIVGRKGNVGSVYISFDDAYPIDTVFHIQSKISIYYTYFNLLLRKYNNNDSAVPGLNRDYAESMEMICPTKNLLDKFDNLISIFFDKQILIKKQIDLLVNVRNMLLPKLMSGEIEV